MLGSRNTRLMSYHLHCAFCNLILSFYRLMYAKKWLWMNIVDVDVQGYTCECKLELTLIYNYFTVNHKIACCKSAANRYRN